MRKTDSTLNSTAINLKSGLNGRIVQSLEVARSVIESSHHYVEVMKLLHLSGWLVIILLVVIMDVGANMVTQRRHMIG